MLEKSMGQSIERLECMKIEIVSTIVEIETQISPARSLNNAESSSHPSVGVAYC
jgi:hypothetical protein